MAILRSAFTQTSLPRVADIRGELSRLDTVINRSSAAVAKQIQEQMVTWYDTVGLLTATEPDATVAATVTLRQLYQEWRTFDRRIQNVIYQTSSAGANAEVELAIATQLRDALETYGWTFA